jgi:hypothetical protein
MDRFVRSLLIGMTRVLEDEGSDVSAGEKQLLTIARAFGTALGHVSGSTIPSRRTPSSGSPAWSFRPWVPKSQTSAPAQHNNGEENDVFQWTGDLLRQST